MPESDLAGRLLDAAAAHAAFDGWSEAALRRAATDCGVSSGAARLIYPRGGVDLASAFHRRADAEMNRRLAAANLEELRFRERVAWAVRLRLELVQDHKEALRRAAAMFALPHHAPEGARLIWETADAIWTALGDSSTDYNWHTKRLTLSAVYSAVFLFWLNDASEDCAQTWAFLDRRIEDVMRFEKLKGQLRANPLARLAFAGPRMALSMIKAPAARPRPPGPGWPGAQV